MMPASNPQESRKQKTGLSPAGRYWQYLYAAKRRKIEWDLTKEQVYQLFAGTCHYCGIQPSTVYKRSGCTQTFLYNGIDRIDSSRGYLSDNVVSCCKACNFAKSEMTTGEFRTWVKRVADHMALLGDV